jgi:hypothetical protein
MIDKGAYSGILSSKAQKEIAFSWEWYEDRQYGLGDRFVQEIIANIQTNNTLNVSQLRTKMFRESRMNSFPFLIIYRINKKKRIIRIVSVFHTSRNPKRILMPSRIWTITRMRTTFMVTGAPNLIGL